MSIRVMAALFVVHGWLLASADAQPTPSKQPAAATFVDPSNGVSLDDAITRALAAEPSLRAVRSTIDVARAVRLQAGLRPNPSASIERREEPGGTDNQTMVNVEWPLDLFRREGRVAVAEREVSAAELSVANEERILAAEVRRRYGEVLVAIRELTLLDDIVAAVRQQHGLLRSRVEEGASPPLERDLLDVELQRLEAERLLQLSRTERAMFELKRSVGIPASDSVRLRDTLEDVVARETAFGVEPVTESIAERRADVREAEQRIGVADAKVDRARRDGRFDINLFGGYTRMDTGFPQRGVSPTGSPERVRGLFNYIAGGAMVTVPIFNRNQGEIAAARAEWAGATAAHEAARLTAQTEVAIALAGDQRAVEAARLYGGGSRTLARQNLAVVRQGYELGRTTVFEVLAEQKRYLENERAYTGVLRAAYEARTALKLALGETK